MNLYLIGVEGTYKGKELMFSDFAVVAESIEKAEQYVRTRFNVKRIKYSTKAHDGKYIVASTFLDTDVR